MGRKILFSPVGGTDPIKYFKDGLMLHICRHYQPDVVYLYLSHEWIKRETGKTVQEIMLVIKYLVKESGINVKESDWKSYDLMNKKIEEYLF